MYYVNCLFIITNKYSIIVVSALYLVLNYNVYKLDCSILLIWYAGVAVQVLQQLREFDAPAMQSCKPLPCGTGSCQNRRLREQTLTRKPCHCGSIKGG